MKRLLSLLLVLAMALALTGCQSRSSEERQTMRSQMDYAKDHPAADSFDYALDDGLAMEPEEIFDRAGLSVTALGLMEEEDYYIIPLRIHNTSEKWFSFFSEECYINGWQVSGSLYEDVCPQGMVDTPLRLYKMDYPEALGSVGEIEVNLECTDEEYDESYEIDALFSLREVPEVDLDLPSLIDVDGVTCALLDCRITNSYLSLDLIVANDTDRDFSLSCGDTCPVINGVETDIDCWDSAWLSDGERTLMSLDLYWMELEEHGIDDLQDIDTYEQEVEFYRGGDSRYFTISISGEDLIALSQD